MNVKDLIKVLQILDPETFVGLQIGRDQEYRDMCAKAELACGDVLSFLVVDMVEIYEPEGDGRICVNIVLKQDNLYNLPKGAEGFDDMYTKKDAENK